MTIGPKNLAKIEDFLRGDLLNVASRQGKPHGGWEMLVEIKGVPAIIRRERCRELYSAYLRLAELNKGGQDPDKGAIYAEYALNVLCQTNDHHRNLNLHKLLSVIESQGRSNYEFWLDVYDVTIGRMLKTQEFHKAVIERMWQTWVGELPSILGAPTDLWPDSFNRLIMRQANSKEEALSYISAVKDHAEAYWLPQAENLE